MKKKYFAIAAIAVSGLFHGNAQTWEAVGPEAGVSAGGAGRMNLVMDGQGDLVLGYYDVTVGKGNVQKYSDGAWTYPGGSADGVTASYATYNSVAADSQGTIYFTNQDSGMQVRQFKDGAWTQLPNAATNTINFQASAVSSDNVLFVASNDASGTIKRYVNGAWEQVGNKGFFGGVPYYLDMAISKDGFVSLALTITAMYMFIKTL